MFITTDSPDYCFKSNYVILIISEITCSVFVTCLKISSINLISMKIESQIFYLNVFSMEKSKKS